MDYFSFGECHHNARVLGDQPGSDDDDLLTENEICHSVNAIFLSTK